ncbi:MAG: 50S ribosomal protein L9 [Spirochaetaceae bacterium]|nr:50S ribosomal protein L9 [Spirochaetaceae bacterium]
MKIILNKDHLPLGEEGDVREVARGYARNYLFPQKIAFPYNKTFALLFEKRREEIEARKAEKRKNALSIKERLEALNLVIIMPAGANGKLYGAVTAQTIIDELAKAGFSIERKRVELPGNSFKSIGKYKVTIKLYESAAAEMEITVQAQTIKTESKSAPVRTARRRRGVSEPVETPAPIKLDTPVETPPVAD